MYAQPCNTTTLIIFFIPAHGFSAGFEPSSRALGSLTIIDKLLADPELFSCLSALIASFRRILAVPPTPTIFFAAGQTPQPVLSEQNLLPPLFRGTEAELCRSCGSYIPHGPHYFHKLDPAHSLFDGTWRVQTLCNSCRDSRLTPSTVPASSSTSLPVAPTVENPAAAEHVRKPKAARTKKLPKPVDGPNAAFLARAALQRETASRHTAADSLAREALERAALELAADLTVLAEEDHDASPPDPPDEQLFPSRPTGGRARRRR